MTQPREKVRASFIKDQNRIHYGTDRNTDLSDDLPAVATPMDRSAMRRLRDGQGFRW